METPLWQPSPEQVAAATLTRFMTEAAQRWNARFDDAAAFHRWSIEEPEQFWRSVWDFAGIIAETQGSVTLAASANVSTALLQVVDMPTIGVGSSSTVVWGQSKLWVSLVLDNTGSMCEPDSNPCPTDTSPKIKINALKKASHNLLTTLQNASANPVGKRDLISPPTARLQLKHGSDGGKMP